MRGAARATAATGWAAASQDWTGVRDPAVREFLTGFRRLDTDEARAVFADHWIRLTSDRLNETWPALYELLRVVKQKELYRNPSWNENKIAYTSFDAYFTETVKQPFATWAELEAAHHFVSESAPSLINETLTSVVTEMTARKRGIAAAEQTTGEVLPSDGSINPGNAVKFRHHSQEQRASESGISRYTQNKLDRLTRDFPSLAAEVCAGRLSVNRAAIEAGFVKQTATIRTDDIDHVAEVLRRHYSVDDIRKIADLAVHLREGQGSV